MAAMSSRAIRRRRFFAGGCAPLRFERRQTPTQNLLPTPLQTLRRCSINWGIRKRAARRCRGAGKLRSRPALRLTGDDGAVRPVAVERSPMAKLRSRPALRLTGDDGAVRPIAIDERSPTG